MSAPTVRTADGTVVEPGNWVVGGHGEDRDYGQVFEREGSLWVAWTGGACQTPIGNGEDLSVYLAAAEIPPLDRRSR